MDSQIVLHQCTDKIENAIIVTNKGTASSVTISIVTRIIKRDEQGICDPTQYLTLSEVQNFKGTPRKHKHKCSPDVWVYIHKIRIIDEDNKPAHPDCQHGSQKLFTRVCLECW